MTGNAVPAPTAAPTESREMNRKARSPLPKTGNRRNLALLAALLVLVTVFLFTFSSAPAEAAGGGTLYPQGPSNPPATADKTSPLYYAWETTQIKDATTACRYLTFCRWTPVTKVPAAVLNSSNVGDAIAGGLAGLINSAAAGVASLIGMVLIWITSLDFVGSGVYFLDYLFAKVGASLFSGASGVSALVPIIFLVALAASVGGTILKLRQAGAGLGGMRTSSIRTLGTTILVVALFFIMTAQAAANHSDLSTNTSKSPIAAMNSGQRLGTAGTSDPANWAVASPGWVFSGTRWLINGASGIVTSLLSEVGKVIGSASTSNSSGASTATTCDVYVGALHYVFYSTPAAKNGLSNSAGVLVAYDQLMYELYYRDHQLASVGGSQGGNAAWCRMAETTARIPVGDQIMVSRVAGLYGELIGTGSMGVGNLNPGDIPDSNSVYDGMGLTTTQKISVGNNSGSLVDQAGNWTSSAKVAANIFGPSFSTPKSTDAPIEASMYWAACVWQSGGSVKLNPEWIGVNAANGDRILTANDCINKDITGGNKDATTGFGADKDGAKVFLYKDSSNLVEVAGWGFGASTMVPKFDGADASSGTNQALDYYNYTQGRNTGQSVVYAVIGAVSIGLVVRYLGGVILGAAVSQAIQLAGLFLLILIFMLAAIPSEKARSWVKAAVMTVLTSMIVTTLLATLFALTFMLIQLCTLLAAQVAHPSGLGGIVLQAIATLLGFWLMRLIVHNLTNLNLATFRGGVQAGMSAGYPVLAGVPSLDLINPLDKNFWSWGKSKRDSTHKSNNPTESNSALDKAGMPLVAAATKAGAPSTKDRQAQGGTDASLSTEAGGKGRNLLKKAANAGSLAAMALGHPEVAKGIQLGAQGAQIGADAAAKGKAKLGRLAARPFNWSKEEARQLLFEDQSGHKEQGAHGWGTPPPSGRKGKDSYVGDITPSLPALSPKEIGGVLAGAQVPRETAGNAAKLAAALPGVTKAPGAQPASLVNIKAMLEGLDASASGLMPTRVPNSGNTIDRLAGQAWAAGDGMFIPTPQQFLGDMPEAYQGNVVEELVDFSKNGGANAQPKTLEELGVDPNAVRNYMMATKQAQMDRAAAAASRAGQQIMTTAPDAIAQRVMSAVGRRWSPQEGAGEEATSGLRRQLFAAFAAGVTGGKQ